MTKACKNPSVDGCKGSAKSVRGTATNEDTNVTYVDLWRWHPIVILISEIFFHPHFQELSSAESLFG